MAPSPEALAQAKSRNLGHLLMRCSRIYNEIGVSRVREKMGMPELRPAHMQVFPHLDVEGTSQAELARRMGMTKQAAGELVADLERMGAVERVPHPGDRRARMVRLTDHARGGLLIGLGVLSEIEARLRGEVGTERMERFIDDLVLLTGAVERVQREDELRMQVAEGPPRR
jgi:DNA-binding MarR family transcriptional regulator